MASNDDISDDAVIALLQRQGLQANRTAAAQPPRRPGTQKPNTSFLKRLVQDTDSHNAALTRKEHRDSRAKLKEFKSLQHATARGEKRSSRSGQDTASEVRSTKRREERSDRWANAFKGLGEKQGQRCKRGGEDDEEQPRIERMHKRDRLLPKDQDDRNVRDRRRSASPVRSRSRSPRRHRERERERGSRGLSPKHRRSTNSRRDDAEPTAQAPTSRRDREDRDHKRDKHDELDSDDPLNELLGPVPRAPSPQVRGRGANRVKINRFSPSYNPDTDQTDDDSNAKQFSDTELAGPKMGAAILKQKRAERLKAAGFTDEEIQKSEATTVRGSGSTGTGTGTLGRTPDNVTWGKKGDDRDWDRGKIVGTDGEWKLEPSWKKGDAMDES